MKVIFYPPHSNSNDYVNLVVEALEHNDVEVVNKKWNGDIEIILKSLFEVFRSKHVIFHFNWLEDNASKGGVLARLKCELLLLFMCLFRLCGGRLVWTMHNASSHNKGKEYQEKFIRRMLKKVSLVVVHCSESIELLDSQFSFSKDKILFVPHGNYCEAMDSYLFTLNQRHNKRERKVCFIYFGAISPYKGVEYLIKAFDCPYLREHADLCIYGKPNSDSLRRSIELEAASIPEIHLEMRFLTNQELGKAICNCDVAVLPYDKDSMQNSGSAIMAFTCGKPVIIPLFGYIKDITDKEFVNVYDYKNETDRIDNLRFAMQEFCRKEFEQTDYSISKGNEARRFAETELNWDCIMKKVTDRYKMLF